MIMEWFKNEIIEGKCRSIFLLGPPLWHSWQRETPIRSHSSQDDLLHQMLDAKLTSLKKKP